MSVVLRDVTVQVSAEADDVFVLAKEAVLALVAGQSVSTLLPDLVKAVDGVKDAVEALKEKPFSVIRSVVLRGLEVAESLTGQDKTDL